MGTIVGSHIHNVGEELVLVGFSIVDQDQGRQKWYRKLDPSVLLEESVTIVLCDDTSVTHNDISKKSLDKKPQMFKLHDCHRDHMYRVDDFASYSVDTQFLIPPFADRQIATIFVLSTSPDASFRLEIKDDEFLCRNDVSNIREYIDKDQGVVQEIHFSNYNRLKFADCHHSITLLKSLLLNLWYLYLYVYEHYDEHTIVPDDKGFLKIPTFQERIFREVFCCSHHDYLYTCTLVRRKYLFLVKPLLGLGGVSSVFPSVSGPNLGDVTMVFIPTKKQQITCFIFYSMDCVSHHLAMFPKDCPNHKNKLEVAEIR